MDINIVINKDIYLRYKEEILKLNARIFSEPYFYDLNNYEVPFDLQGIDNYLAYVDNIIIHSASTFLDYVNIVLVLAYLHSKNYQNKVTIYYYIIGDYEYNKAVITKKEISLNDYQNVEKIKENFINNKPQDIILPIPGSVGFNNFYNLLIEPSVFIEGLDEIIEDSNGDVDEISTFLENKYANMGLSKEYYLKYLNKYL